MPSSMRETSRKQHGCSGETPVLKPAANSDIDTAFARLVQQRVGASRWHRSVLLGAAHQLVALAARHAMPAIYDWREFAAAGGLMSYGRVFAMHIAKPASMPEKFSRAPSLPTCRSAADQVELVINLKTAKTLGLTVPPSLLARADEVIE